MSQDYHRQSHSSRSDTGSTLPVRLFFASALGWLIISSVLGLIVSLKLQVPSFMAGCEWFTYGRLEVLQRNAFTYGWIANAIFGVNLWIMSALARFEFKDSWLAVCGWLGWNLALTFGLGAILLGHLNGYALLEMPKEVAPALFISFLFAALWPSVAFVRRPTGHVFVSQWYIIGASFVFPVAFGITQLLVLWYPTSGVLQALIHSWFIQNIQLLWIGASAISATYYFISKESGRTISAYYLATVGFWTYFLFAGWTAPASLLGGPIPVWIQSVGVTTALMMLVPVIILGINFFGTLSYNRGFASAWNNTTLRFVLVGIVSFAVSSALNIVFSTRSLNAVVRFTDFTVGQQQLVNYGFVSMVLFGAAYYILPRITGSFWPSAKLVHLHFWSCAIGGLGLALHLLICGYPTVNSGVMSYYIPVIFFVLLQLVGHVAFAINSSVMLLGSTRTTNDNTHA